MGLEVGEVVQKIMGHQAEVVDTLGEAVVLVSTKPEVEGARTADCSSLSGGNINDDGAVQINEWLG